MSDYNEYMRAYRAKNRDRINERQRERRKASKSVVVNSTEDVINSIEIAPLHPETLVDGEKCSACHSTKTMFYPERNRWLCLAHRP